MYGKYLSGHTSLVLRPIKVLLLLLFPAFEELHDNIKFVIIGCTQRKLFKENDRQGEREQTITTLFLIEWQYRGGSRIFCEGGLVTAGGLGGTASQKL